MFDLSFFELLMIGAVALVIIGPERLPRVARTVGQWVGKVQRYVADVKRDINREMEFDELRRLRAEMNETARSVEATARSMENSLRNKAGVEGSEDAAPSSHADQPPATSTPGLTQERGADLPAASSTPDVAAQEAPELVPSAAIPERSPAEARQSLADGASGHSPSSAAEVDRQAVPSTSQSRPAP